MRKQIFLSVLMEWTGLRKSAPSQRKQMENLSEDPGIQNFVLEKALELMNEETKELRQSTIELEKNLLETGKLKS